MESFLSAPLNNCFKVYWSTFQKPGVNEFQLNIKFDNESKETAEVWVDGNLNSNSTSSLFDTGCAQTSIPLNEFSSSLKSLGSRSIFDKDSA